MQIQPPYILKPVLWTVSDVRGAVIVQCQHKLHAIKPGLKFCIILQILVFIPPDTFFKYFWCFDNIPAAIYIILLPSIFLRIIRLHPTNRMIFVQKCHGMYPANPL